MYTYDRNMLYKLYMKRNNVYDILQCQYNINDTGVDWISHGSNAYKFIGFDSPTFHCYICNGMVIRTLKLVDIGLLTE